MSSTGVAGAVHGRVMTSRDRFWRPENFSGSPGAVTQALHRLANSGELSHIHRGLYWRGTPTLLGMAPPPADRLAKELGGVGAGPSGRSAALLLGLSTQVPRRDTFAVPGRAPKTPDRLRVVSRAASTKRRTEKLRSAEVALLEVLRDWDAIVEVSDDEAVSIIGRLTEAGAIRVDRVARASATEPSGVRDRLIRLLARLGKSEAARAVLPARARRRELAI